MPPTVYLASQLLECVQSYKYHGFIITSNLFWSEHIQSICNKSGLTLSPVLPECTLLQFYLSCIRPHILNMHAQYWILTWQRENLEAVQKTFCKVCCRNWNMDYGSVLGHLNIPTVQQRRLQLKASMMYQFLHSDSYIPSLKMFYSIPPPTINDT